MALLATANGLSRGLYTRRPGDDRAHQVSTATLVAALLPYVGAVERCDAEVTRRRGDGSGAAGPPHHVSPQAASRSSPSGGGAAVSGVESSSSGGISASTSSALIVCLSVHA